MKLSRAELLQLLQVSTQKLTAWQKKGLPGKGDKFDPDLVADWLEKQGLVEPIGERPSPAIAPGGRPEVATTLAAAAKHFGVSTRTIRTWLKEPGFPGKAAQGRPAFLPLEEIEHWHKRKMRMSEPGGGEQRPTPAREKLAELTYQERVGQLQEVSVYQEFIARIVSATVARLEELPDRVLDSLGRSVKAASRPRIRKTIERTVDQMREEIGELVTGDSDE